MLRIYIIGLSILVIAILANGIIMKTGLKSWYDFFQLFSESDSKAFQLLSIWDYLWLFVGYPIVLGFGYKLGDMLHNIIF